MIKQHTEVENRKIISTTDRVQCTSQTKKYIKPHIIVKSIRHSLPRSESKTYQCKVDLR